MSPRRIPTCRSRLLALAPLALTGCAPEREAPIAVDLSAAHVRFEGAAEPRVFELNDRTYAYVEDEQGAWFERRVEPEEFQQRDKDRYRFRTELVPVSAGSAPGAPPAVRLLVGGEEAEQRPPAGYFATPDEAPIFALSDSHLILALPHDGAPEDVRLRYSRAHGVEHEGRWRVRGLRFSGNGLAVRPGQRGVLRTSFRPGSTLTFATTVEPIGRGSASSGAVRFRVRLDGETLHASDLAFESDGAYAWHSVALPSDGGHDVELSFECEGDLARAAFLAPRIESVSSVDEVPRPDVVIFLADTFRADNITLGGQALDLTPNIDAFAAEGRTFLQARSSSTHTLPGHASLFTGNYPLECGVRGVSTVLPAAATTLAERFAAAGYRTCAITERGMLTDAFGLAQGFEYFDTHRETLEDTLERTRACVAIDDARPLLLFVHTYRAHSPFLVSEETRARHGDSLALEASYYDLRAAFRKLGKGSFGEAGQPVVDAMRDLYLGAVADVDRGFGVFLGILEGMGRDSERYVVFTSDHGEAFGENSTLYHAGPVFETQVRIPLAIVGPGVERGTEDTPVSIVDVAPTILELAELPSAPGMSGRSLIGELAAVPLFLFECGDREMTNGTVAIFDQPYKLMSSESQFASGEIGAAYDLASDPAEAFDVSAGVAGWPSELFDRLGPRLDALMVGRHDGVASQLDGAGAVDLEALGYLGE